MRKFFFLVVLLPVLRKPQINNLQSHGRSARQKRGANYLIHYDVRCNFAELENKSLESRGTADLLLMSFKILESFLERISNFNITVGLCYWLSVLQRGFFKLLTSFRRMFQYQLGIWMIESIECIAACSEIFSMLISIYLKNWKPWMMSQSLFLWSGGVGKGSFWYDPPVVNKLGGLGANWAGLCSQVFSHDLLTVSRVFS